MGFNEIWYSVFLKSDQILQDYNNPLSMNITIIIETVKDFIWLKE